MTGIHIRSYEEHPKFPSRWLKVWEPAFSRITVINYFADRELRALGA